MSTTGSLKGAPCARVAFTCIVALCLVSFATRATAQPLGTFRWQLLPYCNVVTLNVTQQGAVFTLDGFDDQCGAGQRASVAGTAFLNPDGTIGMGLSAVVAPGGTAIHVDARINLVTLGGPWNDSAGHSGAFAFTPAGSAGGPPRPAPRGFSRLFQSSEIIWVLTDLNGVNARRAVLNIPELTTSIVDTGSVQVFIVIPTLSEPWVALPLTEALGATTFILRHTFAPGRVVLQYYRSDNVDPGAPDLGVKVLLRP